MLPLKARLAPAWSHLPLVGIVAASAGLSAAYALPATHWAVMTDELQTVELAVGIVDSLSPLPQIHGEAYGPPSQLYPLLLAPLFGLFPATTAFLFAHGLNALLIASAAWPAFLLGRAVTGSRAGGLFAGALTAFVPWLVLSTTLLTENAAYPAFVWGLFLVHRTITAPSRGHDLAALAGVLVAFLARTQLVVLAAALPLAILLHESALALAAAPLGARLRALGRGARTAVSAHPLLAAAASRSPSCSPPAASAGSSASTATCSAATCFHRGSGTRRPSTSRTSSSAPASVRSSVLAMVLVPALVLQASSFDVRFAAGGFVQDRYLAYLAPVFAVGAAAALLELDRRTLQAGLVLALTAAVLVLVTTAESPAGKAIFWASPASAFHGALVTAAGWAGLSAESLVRLGALLLGLLVAAALWRAPGVAALAATGAAVVGLCVTEVVYVFERVAQPITIQDDTIADADWNWVDDFVGAGTSVALVPYAYLPPAVWWDARFWNTSVDRVVKI